MTNELKVGDKAPALSLPDQSGEPVSLKDFTGKQVVLYFYPKDDTPGCVNEACGFRDVMDDLFENDTVVLGISPDNLHSHQRFVAKYYLPFLLLCDSDKKTCDEYGI